MAMIQVSPDRLVLHLAGMYDHDLCLDPPTSVNTHKYFHLLVAFHGFWLARNPATSYKPKNTPKWKTMIHHFTVFSVLVESAC